MNVTTDAINIRLADWSSQADRAAIVMLLDDYARDPMGGEVGLTDFVKQNLPTTLAATPGAFSVIAWHTDNQGEKPVALANCFTTLSTFACKPLINIHDLAVVKGCRSKGLGQAMLAFVENHARALGCCKITLEVLSGNERARRSYERFGFESYTLDEHTGHALFLQKMIS